MLKRFFVLLCLFSFLSITPAGAGIFNPEEFYLPNGMRVIVIENHRVPAVAHMVWYKVGAANEEPGKSGLAHFFEHLMFKGTPSVPPGEFSKIVKRLGGNDNAFTSKDYTAYYQTVPIEHLETVMKMEADRMANLDLSDENILTERDVIIEERKQRTDNNPSAILREEINSTLFVNHPYSVPVIGWMSEIENLKPDDVKAFYKKWYAPNNAILIVAGDITAATLKPLAEKYYGMIPPTSIPDTTYPVPAPIKTMHRLTYTDPRVGTPSIQFDYRAPKGSEALQVLAEAFGGDTTSPLYKNLVVRDQKAVAAGIFYNPVSEDISSLTIYAVPAPGVSIDDVESALAVEIDTLLNSGLPDDDISRAKQRLIDASDFERDSLMAPAMIFGRALTAGFDIDDIEEWPERIQSVTAADIKIAAEQVFNGADRPVKSFLLPPPPAERTQTEQDKSE